jgi:hypothetical protein
MVQSYCMPEGQNGRQSFSVSSKKVPSKQLWHDIIFLRSAWQEEQLLGQFTQATFEIRLVWRGGQP